MPSKSDDAKLQEISNRTHVSRTPKKPEYRIARSQLQFLMEITIFQFQGSCGRLSLVSIQQAWNWIIPGSIFDG